MSRNSLLAKIHIAKKDLGLDDDTYRDSLESLTGKRSAAELSDRQLIDVLNKFKENGFKPKKKGSFTETNDPQTRMAFALWAELAKVGAIKDSSNNALNKFVKRMVRIDRIEWAHPNELNTVIEALKKMCRRNGINIQS